MTFSGIKSLFLENKDIKQTIFKNTFWLAMANGISKLFKFILFIYIAKILGVTGFGQFTFILAFVGLFAIFSDLGLSQIVTREFAKEKKKEEDFSAIFLLKIILSSLVFFLVLIVSLFINIDQQTQRIIWILSGCILVGNFSEIVYAFFRARQKMEYEFLAKTVDSVTVLSAGFFILFYFPSIENLSYGYLFASVFSLIFSLFILNFKIQKLSLNLNFSVWRKFLLMSWPLALVAIFSTFYSQIDSVMMGFLGQITQTGWYNAASRIAWATLIPSVILAQSFYPVLSVAFTESKEKLQKIWNSQTEIMLLLAIPLMVGGVVLAPKIIGFFYDYSFSPSILAFQILIIMSGIMFIYNTFYWLLIVTNQQTKIFWTIISGAIINIILNIVLIPTFSLYGAAVATVITHLLIMFLLILFTLKFTSVAPFNLGLLSFFSVVLLSSFMMYIVISRPEIYNLNIILTLILGILTYFSTFVVFKKLINKIKI